MLVKVSELFEKEVICVKDGLRLGELSDFEINAETGFVVTIIVYGKSRLFGLLGKEPDLIIPIECVKVFGDDIVLVDFDLPEKIRRKPRKTKLLSNIFD